MALDQATQALLAQLAQAGGKPMHESTPEEARQKMAGLARISPPGPEMARVERHTVESSGQSVIVLAPETPRGVFLWWHGGGWVIGSPDEHETLGRHLAEATGCTVVLAGYRLAPENRFPAALEDALDTLGWVNARRSELAGADDAPLFLAGDSAGGNLAAVVARHAREFNLPIAAQVLVYPVVDHDFENASYTDPANQLAFNIDTMKWFWDCYADPADRDHPDVSPARADDLTDLPPAVILTAEHDLLRDEGEAYAEALRGAGVPVEHRRFDGQMHGFFQMTGVLPSSAEAIEWVGQQVRTILDGR
ncbi:alpha/beta hydrolase [Enemella sp. A6]|uniref:alpha/beta hydrolase n=1 Tax=Enemella sp. A6 TaxID=3440152 RepID=UPI003EBEB1B2